MSRQYSLTATNATDSVNRSTALQVYEPFKDGESHCSGSDIISYNPPSDRARELIEPCKDA